MGGSNVCVEVKPSQGAVPSGEKSVLDLQVKITTTTAAVARSPLNLVIILDKSGSMASEKRLENAKLAIKNIIKSLSEGDQLHLVAYSSGATTVFSAGDLSQPQFLIKKLDELSAAGGTNLQAGFDEALRVAEKFPSPPPRFFVFSDGQVNGGNLRSNPELLQLVTEIYDSRKIKMSSFGLGKDFNEELMTGIAEHGMGVYFFIEGAASMDTFVSHCLQGIVNCVATETKLQLEAAGGATLERVIGYPQQPIQLGDLTENNLRQVIAQVSVTVPSGTNTATLLKWRLSYRPTGSDQSVEIEGLVELPVVKPDGDFLVDEAVQTAAIVARASDYDAEVLRHVDRNDHQEALRKQEEQIQLLSAWVGRDRTGAVESLLGQARDARADLERAANPAEDREHWQAMAKKKVQHQAYQKRRGSMEFIAKNRK